MESRICLSAAIRGERHRAKQVRVRESDKPLPCQPTNQPRIGA